MILKENNIKTKRGCIHKKNAFISILSCFVFIFTLSSKTHASEHTDAEVTAANEHVAGVVTGYTGGTVGQGYPNYPNEQYKTVAVHQKSSTNSDPIFVFGTTILIKDDLYVEGYGYKILFKVTDTKLKRSALEAPVNYEIIHLIFEYTCCICCLK